MRSKAWDYTRGLKPPQSCSQGDLVDKAVLDSGSLSAQSHQLSPCPPTSASQVSFPVKVVQTARWPSPESDAIFFTRLRDGQVQTWGRRIQNLLEWQNVWLHWNTFYSQEEDPSILTHQNSLDFKSLLSPSEVTPLCSLHNTGVHPFRDMQTEGFFLPNSKSLKKNYKELLLAAKRHLRCGKIWSAGPK